MNERKLLTGLFWFRHDCRLTDMPALRKLADQVDRLLCVYVYDQEWFTTTAYGTTPLGARRNDFIQSGLQSLNRQLFHLGQTLIIEKGQPVEVITRLISHYKVTHMGCAAYAGPNEVHQIARLKEAHEELVFFEDSATLLYESDTLPFSLESMPDHFSPFRRKVEKYSSVNASLPPPEALPPPPSDIDIGTAPPTDCTVTDDAKHIGGEKHALNQIDYYFSRTHAVSRYKETRNGMLGWDFSSKFSAWLANGHVSPRVIYEKLKAYEQAHVANESTYWLFFELLWREFFHWQLTKHKTAFFKISGIQNKLPKTSYDKKRFHLWCQGATGFDIVDANMHELNETGFMSNRGRQLVASCFVHELNLDWRYGAAYFEQQLIDFDVASNYGNWQYLAGVGSDPRGHRQFNLEKQAQYYDADGAFRRKWLT
ncbi:DASH family cryptochrome [Alteromonas sediminis]|uniref:Cryptochrome DASH n=1 Tax=Alteromonas sediminis TaxID=2259342 RepID=A0A3N5Y230_9ALTE|nr:DASH family cryptochrome [Alteromonas sediminis]RPJ67350.1 DASH family cryptochrome [Alteromonas sediminis]